MNASSSHLTVAAKLVEKHIPIYEPGQWNPILAAEHGRGSCFAKNVFSAIIFKAARYNDTVTAIQWGSRQHPRNPSGVMLDTTKRPGHSTLLIGTAAVPDRVLALSFNETSHRNSQWQTYDFNEEGENPLVRVDGPAIIPTDLGTQSGVSCYPWYEAGKKYTEALGIDDSVFHTMSEGDIETIVLACLRTVAVPRDIPKTSSL